MIPHAYARPDEIAVMVKFLNTIVALLAMTGQRRFDDLTGGTVPLFVYFVLGLYVLVHFAEPQGEVGGGYLVIVV